VSETAAKRVYVIAGSNGSGKTTFAREFLPVYARCPRFINSDLIAAGLSPFDPAAAAVEAGRLVLREIDRALRAGHSFGFETTLAGRTYLRVLREAREDGCRVEIFYLWIPSPELGLARIRDRVEAGGHNVPEPDVRRRYGRTLPNLLGPYRPLADTVHCFDNSGAEPALIFKDEDGVTTVYDEDLYARITGSTP